ncbi:cyclic peptide export ABC transporter [Mycetohabitans sp. B8]|uniref:cyclic peptide export ABC transporter n=1 Tax=Mycetohabitans sp. B8 TaxID=2841845 RepID=UPI001F02C8C0|nr:cyclic peptide export ABC transporter [Mycetohabitans sp. B8]MCG1042706.1 cyclic peptide export ABC transporter [Mycetohabitans sp. B8]
MLMVQYLKRYYRPLLATAILSSAGAMLTIGLLAYINRLATQGLPQLNWVCLVTALGWFGALCLANGASQIILAKLSSELVGQLRRDLSKQFIEVDYCKLINHKSTIFGVLIEDITRISPLIMLAPHLAYNVILVLICSIYLITLSFQLFLVLLVGLGIPLAISAFLLRSTRKPLDAMRRSEEALFEHFRAIADGKKEMLLSRARAEHFYDVLLLPAIGQAQRLMRQVHLRWNLNEAWSSGAAYGTVFVVVYLGYAAFALPSDVIVRFVIGALFIVGPLNFLIHCGQSVSTGLSSLRHLERVGLDLRSQNATTDEHTTSHTDTKWQYIHAQDLCYRYPESKIDEGIGPFNLSIRRGEMVFIVGDNGSGKSTLMHLLCGLLPPSSGRLCLDEQPVPYGSSAYRERFSSVFGDFFLFSDVLDAKGDALPDAQIRTLLRDLDLDEQLSVDQGKLSKTSLSTGQRKRLALLQCYAEDREVCLFDEWAADQDPRFRQHFYLTLLPQLKQQGKTLIVISHDDRFFHLADRLIVLKGGRVMSDSATDTLANGTDTRLASLSIASSMAADSAA